MTRLKVDFSFPAIHHYPKNNGWDCKTSGDEYIDMAGGIVDPINCYFNMNVHFVS